MTTPVKVSTNDSEDDGKCTYAQYVQFIVSSCPLFSYVFELQTLRTGNRSLSSLVLHYYEFFLHIHT